MNNDPLSALASAWVVSMMATGLLGLALALAPVWDTTVYLSALEQALIMDKF